MSMIPDTFESYAALSKKSFSSLIVLAALMPSANSAELESNSNDIIELNDIEETEVIEVTGIRGSLEDALLKKRAAYGIMDSISAEDIGQLPDDNIAEAMQRITGVQISKDATGEGETMQIRGMANNSVTINGVSMAVGEDRTFNFQNVASEMFSSLEVLKTPTADKIEGSIGGSVNLVTRKPSSLKRTAISMTVKAIKNESNGKTQPSGSLFFGKNWNIGHLGTIGAIATVSYSSVDSRGDTTQVKDYRLYEAHRDSIHANEKGQIYKPINVDINGDDRYDEADLFIFPNGYRARAAYKDSERIGGNVSVEWKPQQNLSFSFEGSSFNNESATNISYFQMSASANSLVFPHITTLEELRSYSPEDFQQLITDRETIYESDPVITDRKIHVAFTNGNSVDIPVLKAGLVTGASLSMWGDPTHQYVDSQTDTYALSGQFEADDWILSGKLSRSIAEREARQSKLNYSLNQVNALGDTEAAKGSYFFNYDSKTDRPNWAFLNEKDYVNLDGKIEYSYPSTDIDTADINTFDKITINSVNLIKTLNENVKDAIRLDFKHFLDLGPVTSFKVGARYNVDTITRLERFSANPYNRFDSKDELNKGLVDKESVQFKECTTQLALENFMGSTTGSFVRQWPGSNCSYEKIEQLFNLGTIDQNVEFITPQNLDSVQEATTAIYGLVTIDQELPFYNWNLRGNVGIRYVDNVNKVDGFANLGTGSVGAIEEGTYTSNAVIYEPFYSEGSYTEILPTISLSLEFTNDMLLRLGYAKTMQKPSIGQLRPNVNYGASGTIDGQDYSATAGNPNLGPKIAYNYDLSFEWYFAKGSAFTIAPFYKDWQTATENQLVPGVDENGEEILIRTQVNVDAEFGSQTGVELSYQQAFNFLPSFWKNTGVNFNYTFVNVEDDLNKIDLEGETRAFKHRISEHSYNAAIWYDDHQLTARLAYNWRSEYEIGLVNFNAINTLSNDSQYGSVYSSSMTMDLMPAGFLTASLGYKPNKKLKFNFSIKNITSASRETYAKHPEFKRSQTWGGTVYNFSAIYKF